MGWRAIRRPHSCSPWRRSSAPSAAASKRRTADAADAAALLERLIDLAPWYEAEVRIVLVRTALRLSDVNEARAQIAAARRLVAREPEAILLRRWLEEADGDVEAFVGSARACPRR